MGTITYKTEDSATTPNPPSGSVQTGVDYSTGEPYYKDDQGVVHSLKGPKGDQGPKGDTGDTGPQGPAGADGADGADGEAATIAVGTTTTGAAGTNADVSNSGTSSAAVFDFTIPRGDKGATGDQGPKGDTGDTGPAGADGHILDVSDLGSITGSITVDLSSAHVFTATLTGDVTLAWSGLPSAGTMTDRVLILTQDATGNRTITWPTGTKWPGGLAYTTDSASVETAVGLLVDSSGNTRAFPVEDFS